MRSHAQQMDAEDYLILPNTPSETVNDNKGERSCLICSGPSA